MNRKVSRKIICLCCTYYQLITVIKLRLTLFKDSEMTVLLSDDSRNVDQIIANLRKTGIFKEVVKAEKTQYYRPGSRWSTFDRFANIYRDLFGTKAFRKFEKRSYDQFMFFNNDFYSSWLFASLQRGNPGIRPAQFEEGLISYSVISSDKGRKISKSDKVVWKIKRHILHRENMQEQLHKFYCFLPAFYKGNEHKTVQIPLIDPSDKKFVGILKNIFALSVSESDYKEKYIYFASLIDTEICSDPVGELKIIDKAAEKVGKDNILIKVHPRDDPDKYIRAGYKVDRRSDVPFEVIQLCCDFSDHVFLTTMSGAVLTISSIMKNYPGIIFTYYLYEKKSERFKELIDSYDRLLLSLQEDDILKTTVVHSFEELVCNL